MKAYTLFVPLDSAFWKLQLLDVTAPDIFTMVTRVLWSDMDLHIDA